MKRYLQVISSVNPAEGGPIEGIKQLSRVAFSFGWEAHVVSLDSPEQPWVRDFPHPLFALGPSSGSYQHSPRLIPWLREHASEYEAVVVNGIWSFSSLATWLGLRKSHVPYVVFTHGMLDPYFRRFRGKHLKKSVYWPLAEYHVLRNAAAVCFTCDDERVLARQSFRPYKCKEVVVNYGTSGPPTGVQAGIEHLAAFWEAWPQLRGKRCLLFLSRIHPKKGCDLLIKAFAEVSKSYPDHYLIMAGPDSKGWQAQLEEQAKQSGIADRIVWTGMLTGDKKWGAFQAAEVFVLPSHQENFGIVVAEALASGTPVLVTDKVNIWREVEEDRAGFVDTDSLEGIVRLLTRWMALPQAGIEAMQSAARSCFVTRFEIHAAAKSLVDLLEKVSA